MVVFQQFNLWKSAGRILIGDRKSSQATCFVEPKLPTLVLWEEGATASATTWKSGRYLESTKKKVTISSPAPLFTGTRTTLPRGKVFLSNAAVPPYYSLSVHPSLQHSEAVCKELIRRDYLSRVMQHFCKEQNAHIFTLYLRIDSAAAVSRLHCCLVCLAGLHVPCPAFISPTFTVGSGCHFKQTRKSVRE